MFIIFMIFLLFILNIMFNMYDKEKSPSLSLGLILARVIR